MNYFNAAYMLILSIRLMHATFRAFMLCRIGTLSFSDTHLQAFL